MPSLPRFTIFVVQPGDLSEEDKLKVGAINLASEIDSDLNGYDVRFVEIEPDSFLREGKKLSTYEAVIIHNFVNREQLGGYIRAQYEACNGDSMKEMPYPKIVVYDPEFSVQSIWKKAVFSKQLKKNFINFASDFRSAITKLIAEILEGMRRIRIESS